MKSMRIPVGAAVAVMALAALAPGVASAACFESGVGCTDTGPMRTWALRQLSCDSLWTVRNTIYAEHGYCFHTARGQAVFDNTGCVYDNASMVPLNAYERDNIARVAQVEKEKRCR